MKLFRPRDNLSSLKHGNVANFSWYASCKHIWRQAIEFEASCLCINGKESVQLTCWKKGKGIVEMEHGSTYRLEGYHLSCYLWNDALQWGGIENSGWYGNHELVIIQVYYLQVLKITNFLWYMSLVLIFGRNNMHFVKLQELVCFLWEERPFIEGSSILVAFMWALPHCGQHLQNEVYFMIHSKFMAFLNLLAKLKNAFYGMSLIFLDN